MDCIQIKVSKIGKYIILIEGEIRNVLPNDLDTVDLLKPFVYLKESMTIICRYYKVKSKTRLLLDKILNEFYSLMRKLNFYLNEIEYGSFLKREGNTKELKQGLERSLFLVKEYYSQLCQFEEVRKKKICDDVDTSPVDISKCRKRFPLSIADYKNIPWSSEYIWSHLIQYKDEVFYIETKDSFKFFYFYMNEDREWYWSPPKMTDKEDVWMLVPEVKIEKGYWKDKPIPTYIEQFIFWLDLFSPDIDEIPSIEKKRDKAKEREKLADDDTKVKKYTKKTKKEDKKKCTIF